jgi:hypothetical protein
VAAVAASNGVWQLFLLLPDVVVHPMDADSPLRHVASAAHLQARPLPHTCR